MKYWLFFGWLVLPFLSMAQELSLSADSVDLVKRSSVKVENINTDAVEYAPSISADGKVMVFESNQTGSYQLYEAKQDAEGIWGTPSAVEKINNYGSAQDLIGGPSISFDGNTMYFFSSFDGGKGAEDIYYSVREADGWSEPTNIGAPVNTREFEGFPSISADGKTLYFVRVKPEGPSDELLAEQTEGQTCYAIYKSDLDSDGNWSVPVKVPYPVNQDCEKAPRIMADNRTMIFSSNRLGGQGKYDLYQTNKDDAGDWTSPIPLDFVNSPVNDQFPCISAQGDQMYFINADDIFKVDIPLKFQQFRNNVIKGIVKDGDTGLGVPAEIIVRDAFTSDELMFLNNNPVDGQYSLVLSVGRSYNVEIRKEGYTTYSAHYNLIDVDEYREVEVDVTLHNSAALQLNIFDNDIFEPITAQIQVSAKGESLAIMNVESDPETGQIIIDLPLGKAYELTVTKENFYGVSFEFDVSGLMIYPNFERNVELYPKKKDVSISIQDITNNSKVRSRIRIRNKNRDEVLEVNGNETVALRVGDRYELEATSDQGYAFNSTIIDVSADENEPAPSVEMKLQPLIIGTALTLRDILFESNSDELTQNSYIELLRVVGLMHSNPTLVVEISAHTDDKGSARYNKLLSERRAKSVVQFLVENEVRDRRFTPVGYGEVAPVMPNDTVEGRTKNRRVELKILAI